MGKVILESYFTLDYHNLVMIVVHLLHKFVNIHYNLPMNPTGHQLDELRPVWFVHIHLVDTICYVHMEYHLPMAYAVSCIRHFLWWYTKVFCKLAYMDISVMMGQILIHTESSCQIFHPVGVVQVDLGTHNYFVKHHY